MVPPNDGSANVYSRPYQGIYNSNDALIYDQDCHVQSIEIAENANFLQEGGGKILTIEDDLIIDNNASLRNIDWVQNGTNTD